MRTGIFVTGTDTNVGKTVVAAALFHRYRGRCPLRYWKPIQTGIERDDDTGEVQRLTGCDETELLRAGERLPRPVSPHLAARCAGRRIDLGELTTLMDAHAGAARWIVEGAGGVLVPVNESDTMADLMRHVALPAVVVARSTLGTINHTLLTLEALRARGVTVAGVAMVGEKNPDNRAAIEQYGRARILAEMPIFDQLTAARLSEWALVECDPELRLLEFLS